MRRGFLNVDRRIKKTTLQTKRIKETRRNWLELPPDVLSMIFIKLGVFDILLRAQSVCSTWRKLSKQPHLYRSIDLRMPPELYDVYDIQRMAMEAVNRSSGQLVEFSMANTIDLVLRTIIQQCSLLRFLRLSLCIYVNDEAILEIAKKFPQLEEVEICHCTLSTKMIEAFGSSCPQLKSFRLNRKGYKGPPPKDCEDEALAIAKNMPELRHLHIFGNYLTDNGLQAILDGCPHLKTLDLRQCFNVLFKGNLKKRSKDSNIELRLPEDSTDDYEFDTRLTTHPIEYDEDYYYRSVHFEGFEGFGGFEGMALSSDDEVDEAAFMDYYGLS